MWTYQLQIVIYFIFFITSQSHEILQPFVSVKFSQLWRAFSLHVSNVSLSNWAKLLILRRYLLSSGVDGFSVKGTCQKLKKTVVLFRSIWEQLEHTWDTTSQRKSILWGLPAIVAITVLETASTYRSLENNIYHNTSPLTTTLGGTQVLNKGLWIHPSVGFSVTCQRK